MTANFDLFNGLRPPTQSGRGIRPAAPPPPAATPSKRHTFHIVTEWPDMGSSLAGIANMYYGDPNQWPKIYNANLGTIKNPQKLAPGQRLVIP